MAQQQPSAAAAAGAAAAALLQKQLAADEAAGADATPAGWSEHQTGDGRKFYYHKETQESSWEKPEALQSSEERANDTPWREYKIWDGRAFYHNSETKVSCWSMPPELRKLRGEGTGIDDKPVQLTSAERRRLFIDLLKLKGVDSTWTWPQVVAVVRDDPVTLSLTEAVRKQCFAELIGFHLRQKQTEARELDRCAASAFERLIEDRFSRPEDLEITYEMAAHILGDEEAWSLIKSDVRRDEVFQSVMERLEEKQKKSRLENRPGRIVRLQRLMATDPDLTRACLRWKDAAFILSKKDEMQEELPELEALRVWSSLRTLKPASEHESEVKDPKFAPEMEKHYRDERRRRDAFTAYLKNLAIGGTINQDSSWADFEVIGKTNPKLAALQEGQGATPMELLDEFTEVLRRDGPEAVLGVIPGSKEAEALMAELEPTPAAVVPKMEPDETRPTKRKRIGFDEPENPVPNIADEDTNALDAMIAELERPKIETKIEVKLECKQEMFDERDEDDDEEEDDDDDPFAEVVAEKERRNAAMKAMMGKR